MKKDQRPRIPLVKPEITDADRAAVMEVLRTPELSMGRKLEEFEEAAAAYVGARFAVAVNSGTSALQLAMRGLEIPAGSEIILPSFTFVAPLNVLLENRLQPVFVDIDPCALNTTPDLVERAITPRTKAIVAVHTFGRPAAADEMADLAARHSLRLIEDACEAVGAEIAGCRAGNFGDAGALAFYPNKQITTGEGGMLITDNPHLAARARRLRNQGRDPDLDWYQQLDRGYSYRLSEMNCALGASQLSRIEALLGKRQRLAEAYDRRLARSGVIRPPLQVKNGRISWFSYVIQFDQSFQQRHRDWIHRRLLELGIQTARYFAPLHLQPLMKPQPLQIELPVTERVAPRCLALPFFNQMTEAEVEEVCSALEFALAEVAAKT